MLTVRWMVAAGGVQGDDGVRRTSCGSRRAGRPPSGALLASAALFFGYSLGLWFSGLVGRKSDESLARERERDGIQSYEDRVTRQKGYTPSRSETWLTFFGVVARSRGGISATPASPSDSGTTSSPNHLPASLTPSTSGCLHRSVEPPPQAPYQHKSCIAWKGSLRQRVGVGFGDSDMGWSTAAETGDESKDCTPRVSAPPAVRFIGSKAARPAGCR